MTRATTGGCARPEIPIQSSGYGSSPQRAPGLALLESSPLPNGFPITARSLVFPRGDTETVAPVLVAFDTRHLDYSEAGGEFSAEAVVIARIRDANGQVLAKMSEQYTLAGASAQMANSQAGRVVFFRKPTIPPGLYQLEAIVYDTHTAKASVRISSLEVPAPSAAPVRVSSLFVVQRAEKVPEAQRDASNPLYFGDTLLYPNIGEPLSKASTKELGFAFVVQPGKAPVTGATVSLLKGGQAMGQAPLEVEKPDASGTIRQIGRLPLDALEPGAYEIRVAVQSGSVAVTRSVRVAIAP